jgi:hypothetical protein
MSTNIDQKPILGWSCSVYKVLKRRKVLDSVSEFPISGMSLQLVNWCLAFRAFFCGDRDLSRDVRP